MEYYNEGCLLCIGLVNGTVIIVQLNFPAPGDNTRQPPLLLDPKVFSQTNEVIYRGGYSEGILVMKAVVQLQFYKRLHSLAINQKTATLYSSDADEKVILAYSLVK